MLFNSISFAEWRYHKDKDKLTDEEYSFAYGYSSKYKYNNDFTVSFLCQGGQVRFEIDADTLIKSKNKPFVFTYRIDSKPAQAIEMKTFSNQGEGGYTYDDAETVANDILGGNRMFVRAITWNNDYLETTISLAESDHNIKKVFSDCGQSLTENPEPSKTEYTFSQFEKDFKKLSVKKQKEILVLLKKKVAE